MLSSSSSLSKFLVKVRDIMATFTPSAVDNLHRMQFYRRQREWKLDRPENSTCEENFEQKDQSSEGNHNTILPIECSQIQDYKQKMRKRGSNKHSHWKIKDDNNNSVKEHGEFSFQAAEGESFTLMPDIICGSCLRSRSLNSLVSELTFMLEANCRPHSSRCEVRTYAELAAAQNSEQHSQDICLDIELPGDIPSEMEAAKDMPCKMEADYSVPYGMKDLEVNTPGQKKTTEIKCVEGSWIALLETASLPAGVTKTKPNNSDKDYLSKVLQCAEKIKRGKRTEQRIAEEILFEEIFQTKTVTQFEPLFECEQRLNTLMVDPKPIVELDYEPETQMLDVIQTFGNGSDIRPKNWDWDGYQNMTDSGDPFCNDQKFGNGSEIHSKNWDWDGYQNKTDSGDPLYDDLIHNRTDAWTSNNNTWFLPAQMDVDNTPHHMMYTTQTHHNSYSMGPVNRRDRGAWVHSDAFHF